MAAAGTANAGRRFFFVDPGKGVIDWPRIFSALRDPGRHYFLVEHDDAVDNETTSPAPQPSRLGQHSPDRPQVPGHIGDPQA